MSGPGNNGGDGLVAAHYLREAECDVTLYIWKRDPKGDRNLSRLKRRKRGVTILWADNDPDFDNLRQDVRGTSLVIDALLGTGVARPLGGKLAEMLAVLKRGTGRASTRGRPRLSPFPMANLGRRSLEAFGGARSRSARRRERTTSLDAFITGFPAGPHGVRARPTGLWRDSLPSVSTTMPGTMR